jgi:hypothetical protein
VDFVVAIDGAGIVCLEVKETVQFWEHNLPLQMTARAADAAATPIACPRAETA